MTGVGLDAKTLAAAALGGGGKVPLAFLLERLVPVGDLRALAQELGIVPKGYRPEKAPAAVLAPLLVEKASPEVLDRVCALLAGRMASTVPAEAPESGPAAAAAPAVPAPPAVDLAPVLRLREQELAECRANLQRALDTAQRLRERDAEWSRRVEALDEQLARQRAELAAVQRARDAGKSPPPPATADDRRVRDLERELELLSASEHEQRLRSAEQATRIRELEERVAELEPLVPKGRRRKAPPPPPPPVRERFRIPYVSAAFYRSMADKDRRAVQAAFQAIALYCTHGPSYPGLEVKPIEGQNLWSLRASLRLRVYFRVRDDGDAEFLELADREDQHTALRRLKDR
ncbi:MAG: hypothetical protein IT458_05290 [Planctomycetes bacterium]|nr:hypothetical protein [Planctomycetota bacterium]